MGHGDRIRGFDGVRAIAVVLVFFAHKTDWAEFARSGHYGVWLFFVLSGFLITGQLLEARQRIETGRGSFGQELLTFWIKRALRIMPAYYFILCVTMLYYLFASKPLDGLWYYVTYTTNLYYELVAPELTSLFGHFWSLAVEEQFYVLIAPLVLCLVAKRAAGVLVALIMLALLMRLALVAVGLPEVKIYIDSFVCFGVLAQGGLIYMFRQQITNLLHGLEGFEWAVLTAFFALIGVGGCLSDMALRQTLFLLATVLAAALVAAVYVRQDSALTNLLELPWIAWLGRLSYGFYLYEPYVPADLPRKILVQCQKLFPNSLIADPSPATGVIIDVVGFLTSFLIIMVVTYMSWIAIEKPAMGLRRLILPMIARRHQAAGLVPNTSTG